MSLSKRALTLFCKALYGFVYITYIFGSSKKACQKSCDRGAVKPRKCKQSMKKGSPCAFGTIRWLYNKRTNTCEQTAEKMCSQTGDNKFGFT